MGIHWNILRQSLIQLIAVPTFTATAFKFCMIEQFVLPFPIIWCGSRVRVSMSKIRLCCSGLFIIFSWWNQNKLVSCAIWWFKHQGWWGRAIQCILLQFALYPWCEIHDGYWKQMIHEHPLFIQWYIDYAMVRKSWHKWPWCNKKRQSLSCPPEVTPGLLV